MTSKHKKWGRGVKNVDSLTMCLHSNDYCLKQVNIVIGQHI